MEKDKRYLVFYYSQPFTASGGMDDLHSSYDTKEEAIECHKNIGYWAAMIYDRIEGYVIND